ncbi:MAG: RNA polymerase sigma factor, partial [bacterium]
DIAQLKNGSLHLGKCLEAMFDSLAHVEGYSYAEIGETLSLSDSQVQVYLFRARVTMRKQLKQMGYGVS